MNPDGYIREIESINEALKRTNEHTRKLRAKKKIVCDRLYKYMEDHDIEKYGDYKKSKLEPKEKKKRKKINEKRQDAIELFRSIGVVDPEGLWDDFQKTQTVIEENSEI